MKTPKEVEGKLNGIFTPAGAKLIAEVAYGPLYDAVRDLTGDTPPKRRPAIVVGHKKSSQGAVSSTGVTEWIFNMELAVMIGRIIDVDIIERPDRRRGYNDLPGIVNDFDPTIVLSLHCNAFDTTVNGSEALYWHRSRKGQEFARQISSGASEVLSNVNRGAKPLTVEDRGGYLVRNVNAVCVIAEPLFIDNDNDFPIGNSRRQELAEMFADTIKTFVADDDFNNAL